MNIPNSCDECPYENYKDWICTILNKKSDDNKGENRWQKRLNDCPLPNIDENTPYYINTTD